MKRVHHAVKGEKENKHACSFDYVIKWQLIEIQIFLKEGLLITSNVNLSKIVNKCKIYFDDCDIPVSIN